MPKMMYGTAWKKEATTDHVINAIKAGFGGIDTACQPKHYREDLVGDALALFDREELFIQTKFTPKEGQDPTSISYNPNDPLEKQVADSFEVSKHNLKTDYVNALVLHSPLFPSSNLYKVWGAMEEIYHRGEALELGMSNCYELSVLSKLHENATIKPTILQNRFYGDSGYDKEIRAWCRENGVQYQSFWSLTANPHILGSETLFHIAKAHQKSGVQIWYRFLTQIGITPLNGTTSTEHMKEDLSIFNFELSEVEVERIYQLLS